MKRTPLVTAIIVAAGNSQRMNTGVSKQLINVNGMTVIARSIKAFENSDYVDNIIIVCRNSERKAIESEIKKYDFTKVYKLTSGGETRAESVKNGINASKLKTEYFAIHDGARCFIKTADIDRVITSAFEWKASALAVRVNDTVKKVDSDGIILDTVSRDELRLVQTPQVFEKKLYLDALKFSEQSNKTFTDDCQIVENFSKEVKLIEGSKSNMKITTPEDLKNIVKESKGENMYKTGHGYDVHRLVKGRKLVLGGVEIEHITGLLGHSDADVLTHSVIDALLGASGLGDIGTLFPDTDTAYKDAYSINLLSVVVRKVRQTGFEIGNIDVTVLAQAPKLSPFIDNMKSNIIKACNIDKSQINIKATTEEGLGFTGKKEGIASHAVCLIYSV